MRGLRIVFLISTLVAICSLRSAEMQSNVIRGQVLDVESLEALAGVKVEIEELGKTVYTDLNGVFTVAGLNEGVYTANISYVSYHRVQKRIIYPNNSFVQVKIQMSE